MRWERWLRRRVGRGGALIGGGGENLGEALGLAGGRVVDIGPRMECSMGVYR